MMSGFLWNNPFPTALSWHRWMQFSPSIIWWLWSHQQGIISSSIEKKNKSTPILAWIILNIYQKSFPTVISDSVFSDALEKPLPFRSWERAVFANQDVFVALRLDSHWFHEHFIPIMLGKMWLYGFLRISTFRWYFLLRSSIIIEHARAPESRKMSPSAMCQC